MSGYCHKPDYDPEEACISCSIIDKLTEIYKTDKSRLMIKIYGMETCPDCTFVKEQVKDNGRYEVIDIGAHVRNLKEFLRLRDNSPAFDNARKEGRAGIPCFVLEDGTVTLSPEAAGLKSRPSDSVDSVYSNAPGTGSAGHIGSCSKEDAISDSGIQASDRSASDRSVSGIHASDRSASDKSVSYGAACSLDGKGC